MTDQELVELFWQRREEALTGLQDKYGGWCRSIAGRILGEEREVLCEGYDSQAQMFYGRSYAESPDIDGRIWFTADSEIVPGTFVNVRLTGTMDGETTGELV